MTIGEMTSCDLAAVCSCIDFTSQALSSSSSNLPGRPLSKLTGARVGRISFYLNYTSPQAIDPATNPPPLPGEAF